MKLSNGSTAKLDLHADKYELTQILSRDKYQFGLLKLDSSIIDIIRVTETKLQSLPSQKNLNTCAMASF